VALAIIFGWYFGLGILAALGTIGISRTRLTPRAEPMLFGVVLVPVAAIYLAFTAHFGIEASWRNEAIAAAAFAAMGLIGIRAPLILILAYALHGAWDALHEIAALVSPVTAASTLTPIPLAYGAFCAAFDFAAAGYLYVRRTDRRQA
jgi:hypothetical protein